MPTHLRMMRNSRLNNLDSAQERGCRVNPLPRIKQNWLRGIELQRSTQAGLYQETEMTILLSFLKLTTHTLQSSLWCNMPMNLILQPALLFTWCSTRSQRAHEKLNREHKIWMEWSLAHKSSAVLERCFTNNECWNCRNKVSVSLSKEDATIFKPL